MLKKAATSCLSLQDVKALQFEPYTEEHDLDIFPRFAGFKIPYFTLDGKIDPSIYRFRFVQTQPSKGFAAIAEAPKKPRRYGQPAGTQCGVYLPPILDLGGSDDNTPARKGAPVTTWRQIANDVQTALIITEGELKAACGCKLGMPTIGLGGVFNWRSTKDRVELLPILEKFKWNGRTTYIAFDSDAKENPMVCMAASRLAYTLAVRGALVRFVQLPPAADGSKQGMDDLIYSYVSQAKSDAQTQQAVALGLEAFGELLAKADDLGPGQELHRLNDEVGFVRATAEIIEIHTGNVYSHSVFTDAAYKHRTFNDKGENGQLVKKFAAKEWMAWPLRTEFKGYDYAPACTNLITPDGAYNTWYSQRWPLVPVKKGDIKLWERLFNHIFGKLTDADRLWARRWFACPIQRPGTKLFTALLVWGRTTGTGKSRIGESMASIYGRNFGIISNDHLTDNFNEWAESKQFIVGDEISIGDRRGVANKLKALITQPTFRLNVKHRKSYEVRDCINYYFSSNHEDALYLENNDRRFFVVNADVPRLEPEFYEEYTRWLNNGGAARLYYHFLYEVDLGDFNPAAEAPVTTAKLEMMAIGRSDVEDWAFQLNQNPDTQLGPRHQHDLYSAKELLRIYDPDEKTRIRANGMSRALNAAGVFKCANGSNHVYVAGARDTVYAVRNAARYQRLGPAEITRLYEQEREGERLVGQNQRFAPGASGGVKAN